MRFLYHSATSEGGSSCIIFESSSDLGRVSRLSKMYFRGKLSSNSSFEVESHSQGRSSPLSPMPGSRPSSCNSPGATHIGKASRMVYLKGNICCACRSITVRRACRADEVANERADIGIACVRKDDNSIGGGPPAGLSVAASSSCSIFDTRRDELDSTDP